MRGRGASSGAWRASYINSALRGTTSSTSSTPQLTVSAPAAAPASAPASALAAVAAALAPPPAARNVGDDGGVFGALDDLASTDAQAIESNHNAQNKAEIYQSGRSVRIDNIGSNGVDAYTAQTSDGGKGNEGNDSASQESDATGSSAPIGAIAAGLHADAEGGGSSANIGGGGLLGVRQDHLRAAQYQRIESRERIELPPVLQHSIPEPDAPIMQLAAAALRDKRQSASATNQSGLVGVDRFTNTSFLHFPGEISNSLLQSGDITDHAPQKGAGSTSGGVRRLQPTSFVPGIQALETEGSNSTSVSLLQRQTTLECVAEAADECE